MPATGKRTDVTFSSNTSVVILELKQVASETPPTADYVSKAQEQLAGYVKTRQAMEEAGKGRAVAGFVVIMYDNGAGYVVQKLRQNIQVVGRK